MKNVGQIEKLTQARVVKLLCDQLGYDNLGNWTDRAGNRNIEACLLRVFLNKQGYDEGLISRAIHLVDKAASDTSKSLFDRNKAVYELLRHGVKVKPEVGENTQTVWLIDWKQPLNNDFSIAEEVTVKAADAKANSKRPDVLVCQRHRAGCAGAKTFNGVGGRRHAPESGQPESGFYRAFFLHYAVINGG